MRSLAISADDRSITIVLAGDHQVVRQALCALPAAEPTAESHRAKVMSKLRLRREADLIRFALRHGILPLDPEPRPGG